jgi:hypothetical protein
MGLRREPAFLRSFVPSTESHALRVRLDPPMAMIKAWGDILGLDWPGAP